MAVTSFASHCTASSPPCCRSSRARCRGCAMSSAGSRSSSRRSKARSRTRCSRIPTGWSNRGSSTTSSPSRAGFSARSPGRSSPGARGAILLTLVARGERGSSGIRLAPMRSVVRCALMDVQMAARQLVSELVKGEQIEVRRAEIVGRDLAKWVGDLARPPSADELEGWLGEHRQVSELYAPTSLLGELITRHLLPPPPPPAEVPAVRNAELERELREAPEAPEGYLVYADWLQEHGDPMGELIALGARATGGSADDVANFDAFLKRHHERFLDWLPQQRLELRWQYGYVRALEEDSSMFYVPASDQKAIWQLALGLRVCELVRSIKLARACSGDREEVIDAAALPLLR